MAENKPHHNSTSQIALIRQLVHELAKHGAVHGLRHADGTELSYMAIDELEAKVPRGPKAADVKIILARPADTDDLAPDGHDMPNAVIETEYLFYPNDTARKYSLTVPGLPEVSASPASADKADVVASPDMPVFDLDDEPAMRDEAFDATTKSSTVVSEAELHDLLERLTAAGKSEKVISQ